MSNHVWTFCYANKVDVSFYFWKLTNGAKKISQCSRISRFVIISADLTKHVL
jgi:hypothetical protein